MTSPRTESHTEWGWGTVREGANGIFSRSLIIQLVLTWGN